MADGVSVSLANSWLTGLGTLYLELHTGDPGSAGTSNLSSTTSRQSMTFGTASGGSDSITGTPTWSSWSGTNAEVVTDLAEWTASTSGTFDDSIQLSSNVTMYTGYTLVVSSLTESFTTAS